MYYNLHGSIRMSFSRQEMQKKVKWYVQRTQYRSNVTFILLYSIIRICIFSVPPEVLHAVRNQATGHPTRTIQPDFDRGLGTVDLSV